MRRIGGTLAIYLAGLALLVAGLALAFFTASEDSGASGRASAKADAAPVRLVATVGPGFTISLSKGGKKVKTLKRGTYRITVRDRSVMHNFHLSGPSANRKTRVPFSGTVVWRNVKLKNGTYRFVCDPHRRTMKGSFKVGAKTTVTGVGAGGAQPGGTPGGTTGGGATGTTYATTTTGTDGGTTTQPAPTALSGSVGPGFTISLGVSGTLPPGAYRITIDDLSTAHNFHLQGPGVDMATAVETTGTVMWDATLSTGTYNYQCDPHASMMNGSFQVG